mmetsp:Transcript_73418/g.210787  ORF Transcript_73418/g.210787 Transcript_73418/m.210787 type:complete len:422 (+) Transcript_73418:83-1348(+)
MSDAKRLFERIDVSELPTCCTKYTVFSVMGCLIIQFAALHMASKMVNWDEHEVNEGVSERWGDMPDLYLCSDPVRSIKFSYADVSFTGFEGGDVTTTAKREFFNDVHAMVGGHPVYSKADTCVKFNTGVLKPKFSRGADGQYGVEMNQWLYLTASFEDLGLMNIKEGDANVWSGLDFWYKFPNKMNSWDLVATIPTFKASAEQGLESVFQVKKERTRFGDSVWDPISKMYATYAEFANISYIDPTKRTKLKSYAISNPVKTLIPSVPDRVPEVFTVKLPAPFKAALVAKLGAAAAAMAEEPVLDLSTKDPHSPGLQVARVCLRLDSFTVREIQQMDWLTYAISFSAEVGGYMSLMAAAIGCCFIKKWKVDLDDQMERQEALAFRWKFGSWGITEREPKPHPDETPSHPEDSTRALLAASSP